MENDQMIDNGKTILNTHKRIVTKRRKHVATYSDPREELRHLVRQHKALTKASVAVTHMASDRKNHETGETIECRLPEEVQIAFKALAKDVAKKKAESLETTMFQQLRLVPIYKQFLKNVFGIGPVVAAYLVSEIDIHRAIKSSALRRFCGLAVINGRLERRQKGVKSAYSSELRTRLYQAFSSMWTNGRGKGKTSKYLKIWVDAKHRKMQMATEGKINNGVRSVSAKGYAHSYGWHKAADIFIEDLYMAWRAIEGLDVWPSYYAAKLGYEHGGKISVNVPRQLSIEEALALIGDVSGQPYKWNTDVTEEVDEEELAA